MSVCVCLCVCASECHSGDTELRGQLEGVHSFLASITVTLSLLGLSVSIKSTTLIFCSLGIKCNKKIFYPSEYISPKKTIIHYSILLFLKFENWYLMFRLQNLQENGVKKDTEGWTQR